MFSSFNKIRHFKCKNVSNILLSRFMHEHIIDNELNVKYLCNPENSNDIAQNIIRRKGVGDIKTVINLYHQLKQYPINSPQYEEAKLTFMSEVLKIPNETHKEIIEYGDKPHILKYLGLKRTFNFNPREFDEITKNLNVMRTSQLGNVAGTKSYYFCGSLAELEQALIKYTVKKLLKNNFKLLSVPDILPSNIIENCGMATKGERTQVYKLLNKESLCLSGTSEMAIAGYFKNKIIEEKHLPIKVAAVSRCYRAETSSIIKEKGIYRVHEFTKVEMFALTHPEDSAAVLETFRQFQEEHFSSLGIHLRTLDMPPYELGPSAYRKYDVEAWLPGRNIYGEVSSCSNCTDYQAMRLGIKFKSENNKFNVHTVNGTALAVPRILLALLETFQNEDGTVQMPDVLKPYLRFEKLDKEKHVPELKLKKVKRN